MWLNVEILKVMAKIEEYIIPFQMHFDDDPVYAKIENTFATWR